VTRKEAPKNALHLSWRLKSNFPNLSIIHSTIDLKKQVQAESIVKQYMIPMKNKNVHNAAALVIDNDTHEVIAYIGSDDFNDLNFNGQVDGVQAIRSPGSTLKPFLYGLAMDKGLITPKTILADVPILITGYQPSNYDDKFHGLITAEYALANSLNIPAVKLLKDIGINEFIGKLDSAGFKSIVRQKKKLGLSLILGGCGATLEQLTSLFSIFPNYGQYTALKFNEPIDLINQATSKTEWNLLPYLNDAAVPKEKPVSLMSAPAAFMVTQILTTLTRPDLPNNFESSTNLVKIAWKTGTSYGRKDAWSIGYNKKYTIGVWVGNFNGMGVPDLNGADFATPLLFQLFNSLASNSSNEWFQTPSTLQLRSICSESGNIPNTFCTNIISDNYIPQTSSNELCSHLKPIYSNRKASLSYCTSCMPDTGAVQNYYPNYAASVIAYFESIKLNFKKIPNHNTACERIFTENDPVIISLNEGIIYYLDATESQQLKLLCQAANDVKTVFWFANGIFIKSSLVKNPVFITPNEGLLKITCVDDRGRKVNCEIEVKKMREEN
jgi:penicillin-binding protein 1C